MEHYMQLDLEKQTTEKLDEMLNRYLSGEKWKDNANVTLEIIQILACREKDIFLLVGYIISALPQLFT